MRKTRISLATALFGLMFATTVTAIIAITAVTGINLRSGFSNYVQAREADRLRAFAGLVSEEISNSGGLDAFRDDPGTMRRVLDQLNKRLAEDGSPVEHMEAGPGPQKAPGAPDRPPPAEFDPGKPPPDNAPPGSRPRPQGFPGRVALFAPNGKQISGFPFMAKRDFIEEAVVVDGRLVAIARLTTQVVPNSIEAQFLRNQFSRIGLTALILFGLAALVSWQLARRMARPLKEIQAATAKIAGGNFSVVLEERSIDEIAKTVANINAMTVALQKLESNRRRWLAQVAHELRTPVTVLRGELEAQIDGVEALTPAAMHSLHEEVLRLMAVIDDLHLVSLSDLGKVPCAMTATDAAEIGVRMRERFLPMARKMGFDIQLNYDAASELIVDCDEMRIEQVLGNLLTNSLRYTDPPGTIFMKIQRTHDGVVFSVDDGAPGVSENDIGHVFEPLYRVDASRSRSTGGSGLGLAVCKAIIEAHDGRIAAEPSPHGGLSVYFWIPASGAAP